ncbi:MAG: SAM-dependent methyltransferase [Planctomycetota bacterium]
MTIELEDERKLARLYDDLARYQWWRRQLRRTPAGSELEMHKRLNPGSNGSPGAGTSALHNWLWDQLSPESNLRALDVGCGFGATLFSLAGIATQAELVGLSLSPYQIRVAGDEAQRLGIAAQTKFMTHSFDAPLAMPPVDLVLSVESLFHAPELANTIPKLAQHLAEAGQFALVEDMAVDDSVAECRDGCELLRLWSTRQLYTSEHYRIALKAADLVIEQEFDLTDQVPNRNAADLDRSERQLRRIRKWTPTAGWRRMLDAFIGGIHLERLYLKGQMRYRVMIARSRRGE